MPDPKSWDKELWPLLDDLNPADRDDIIHKACKQVDRDFLTSCYFLYYLVYDFLEHFISKERVEHHGRGRIGDDHEPSLLYTLHREMITYCPLFMCCEIKSPQLAANKKYGKCQPTENTYPPACDCSHHDLDSNCKKKGDAFNPPMECKAPKGDDLYEPCQCDIDSMLNTNNGRGKSQVTDVIKVSGAPLEVTCSRT